MNGRAAGMDGLSKTLAIFMSLAQPLDFDAADNKPVNLVFALLVPEHATDAHLKLLAHKLHPHLTQKIEIDQPHKNQC